MSNNSITLQIILVIANDLRKGYKKNLYVK